MADYAKPNVISNLDEFPAASIQCLRIEREWSFVTIAGFPLKCFRHQRIKSPGKNAFRF